MGEKISKWARISATGFRFGPDPNQGHVTPEEFHGLWLRFRASGELPTHRPSARVIRHLDEALQKIEETDGG